MTKIAVYPGTFDPITYGHVDIITRGAKLFDEVIVAIAANVGKNPLFSLQKRLEMTRAIFSAVPQVKVETFSGLLVNFMTEKNAQIVLRGLRSGDDVNYEFQLAVTNRYLKADIETVFLKADEKFAHISSTIVREVAVMGGDLSAFVPPIVIETFKHD